MVALDVKHSIEPVKVTAGHPFYALRGVPLEQANDRTVNWLAKGKVKPEWVEAGQLQKGDYVAQVIPTETAMVDSFDADDARLYGILLGDGICQKTGCNGVFQAIHKTIPILISCVHIWLNVASIVGKMGVAKPTHKFIGQAVVKCAQCH